MTSSILCVLHLSVIMGHHLNIGDVVIQVDPRYFRPAEVETLLGDPSN